MFMALSVGGFDRIVVSKAARGKKDDQTAKRSKGKQIEHLKNSKRLKGKMTECRQNEVHPDLTAAVSESFVDHISY